MASRLQVLSIDGERTQGLMYPGGFVLADSGDARRQKQATSSLLLWWFGRLVDGPWSTVTVIEQGKKGNKDNGDR